MIKELDEELKKAIDETMPFVRDAFDVILKHSGDNSTQIEILAKAFENMGLQYDINFKVAAIKKCFDELDDMLHELLEIEA